MNGREGQWSIPQFRLISRWNPRATSDPQPTAVRVTNSGIAVVEPSNQKVGAERDHDRRRNADSDDSTSIFLPRQHPAGAPRATVFETSARQAWGPGEFPRLPSGGGDGDGDVSTGSTIVGSDRDFHLILVANDVSPSVPPSLTTYPGERGCVLSADVNHSTSISEQIFFYDEVILTILWN